MKHLTMAVLALMPAVAFAQTTPAPQDSSQPAAAPAAAPAAGPEATAEKKGEQKTEQAVQTAISTPDQLAQISGWTFAANLDHYVGTGTFINPQTSAYLVGAVDFSPRYQFPVKGIRLAVSTRLYFSYEYTMPDTANGRRVAWRDLPVSVSAPAVFRSDRTGISLTPSLSWTIPITMESWQATMIGNLGAGITATRSIGKFDLQAGMSGSHGFFKNTANVISAQQAAWVDGSGNQLLQCRTGEPYCANNGNNVAWSLGGSLGANFRVTDELAFSVSYLLRTSWKYAADYSGDQYTPPGQRVDGTPVATVGMARSDIEVFSLSVYYQLHDHYGISLYTYTAQTPMNSDGKSLRNPFWTFGSAALGNYTSVGVTLSANY